jgi:hypothetical protein
MTSKRVKSPSRREVPTSRDDTNGNFQIPPVEDPGINPTTNLEGASRSIRENLAGTARSVGAAAQEQLSTLGEDIGEELNKAAEKQKTRGVESIRAVSKVMDTAAAELTEISPAVAEHVRTASKSVADLSQALEARDVNELFRSALGIAKENPVLFFTGAVASGFLISRFLKSSSEA